MTQDQIIEIKKSLAGILQANFGNRITPELGNGILTSLEQQLVQQAQQYGQPQGQHPQVQVQTGPNDAVVGKG